MLRSTSPDCATPGVRSRTPTVFVLLRRFGVSRAQAMRLDTGFAREVAPAAASEVLTRAASEALPVMIFVGNAGSMQIHSGPVVRIERMGPWLNVLDPRFTLHLREDQVAGAYLVRKPSVHGDIHSLELYDATGEIIVQVFGSRPPQGTERPDWRALVMSLPSVRR